MGVADAGGDHVLIARHLLIQLHANVVDGLLHGFLEGIGVGNAHIQQIDGIVQHGLQIQPHLVVLIHPGEGPQGHLDVIVQPVDVLVQPVETGQEVEFQVQRAGVGLDIHGEGLAALGVLQQQKLPVVHVRALADLAVDEDQELGVLAVVPLLDLGADLHPDIVPGEGFGDGDLPPEPVVGAQDALEVRDLALESALELLGAHIVGVPAHGVGVKLLPVGAGRVSLLRTEELAGLILPVGQLHRVPEPQKLQLVCDYLNSLVDKVHRNVTSYNDELTIRVSLGEALSSRARQSRVEGSAHFISLSG